MDKEEQYDIVKEIMNRRDSKGIVKKDDNYDSILVDGRVYNIGDKLIELYEKHHILSYYEDGKIICYS